MLKKGNPFLWVGIFGTFIIGSQLAAQYGQTLWGNRDICWTPKAMAVSLDETRHHFEMFLRDELLQNLLERRTLSVNDPERGVYQVSPGDIKIRLNNWDTVKASFLNTSVFLAFLFGISVTCLFWGIMQTISQKNKSP